MILVTGGSGLVGSHLLLQLRTEGRKVRVLKRRTTDTGWIRRIFDFYEPRKGEAFFSGIEWVNGDITDSDSLEEAFSEVDTVYHTAGYVSFDPGENRKLMNINVRGTRNMIDLALDNGIKKFCHVSSVASLGKHLEKNKLRVSENNYRKMKKEKSGYGFSKLLAELEVWRGMQEGLQAAIVNPVIILGPGNWNRGSASLFKSIRKGLSFYPSGSNGYVDARDVARVMTILMEKNISGERFILCAENLSFRRLFTMIAGEFEVKPPPYRAGGTLMLTAAMADCLFSRITGRPHQITRETARSGNEQVFYSSNKVRNTLGYEFIPVEEAIRNAVRFYRMLETKI